MNNRAICHAESTNSSGVMVEAGRPAHLRVTLSCELQTDGRNAALFSSLRHRLVSAGFALMIDMSRFLVQIMSLLCAREDPVESLGSESNCINYDSPSERGFDVTQLSHGTY